MSVLVIDIGGTHVKIVASGQQNAAAIPIQGNDANAFVGGFRLWTKGESA
jgi:hypothetical protein